MTNIMKFGLDSKYKVKNEDMAIFFVNKPDMIMTMQELEERYPKIYEEVHVNIRKGVWDGA